VSVRCFVSPRRDRGLPSPSASPVPRLRGAAARTPGVLRTCRGAAPTRSCSCRPGAWLLVVLLAVVAPARGEDRSFRITAVDAATNDPVAWRYALTRDRRVVRRGAATPRARTVGCRTGDRLLVFHPSYDLAVVRIGPSTPRRVQVALTPAGTTVVSLAGTTAEQRRRLRVEVHLFTPRLADGAAIDVRRPLPVGDARIEVPVPTGVVAMLDVRADTALAWPPRPSLEPGRTIEVRLDPARTIPVRWPEAVPASGRDLLCLPDRKTPPPGPPPRTDAWRWHTNGAGWRVGTGLEHGVRLLPDCASHLFWVAPDGPRYRFLDRRTKRLDLSGPAGTRLLRRPVVDGRPVPAGTWIGVGRLDLTALYLLGGEKHEGLFLRSGARSWGDASPRLAAADHVTLWHPGFGLAHAPWNDGQAPAGSAYSARIRARFPPGLDVSGDLVAYPVWRGTGRVATKPPCEKMAITFSAAPAAVFPGVRPGAWYGVLVNAVLSDPKTGRIRRVRHKAEVRTPDGGGTATVRVR